MFTYICSIDIGKKNFAFYIEKFSKDQLLSLKNIPEPRYKNDGTPTDIFQDLLKQIYKNGECVLFVNSDLTVGTSTKKYLDTEVFHNMTDLLDKYKSFWDKCDAIIIEKQMSFGKNKTNTMALKLGQHCWSYFAFNYSRYKQIIEFPAYHKTQVLGAPKKILVKGKPKNMDKPHRKKWCVEKTMEILDIRNDLRTLEILNNNKKKDDLSDIVCQLQAFKYLVYVKKKL